MNIRFHLTVMEGAGEPIPRAHLIRDVRGWEQAPARDDAVRVLDTALGVRDAPMWIINPPYGTSPRVVIYLTPYYAIAPQETLALLREDGWEECHDAA